MSLGKKTAAVRRRRVATDEGAAARLALKSVPTADPATRESTRHPSSRRRSSEGRSDAGPPCCSGRERLEGWRMRAHRRWCEGLAEPPLLPRQAPALSRSRASRRHRQTGIRQFVVARQRAAMPGSPRGSSRHRSRRPWPLAPDSPDPQDAAGARCATQSAVMPLPGLTPSAAAARRPGPSLSDQCSKLPRRAAWSGRMRRRAGYRR